MGCCGRKRALWAEEARRDGLGAHGRVPGPGGRGPDGFDPSGYDPDGQVPAGPGAAGPAPAAARGPVWFEYVGRFRRLVMGQATRQVYEFAAPGARVAVAPPDAPALRAETDLRVIAVPGEGSR